MHGTEINVVGPRGRSNSIYVPCISAKSHPATQIQTPEMGSPNGHPGGQISVSESQISDLGGQISDLGVQIWTSGPQILRSETSDPEIRDPRSGPRTPNPDPGTPDRTPPGTPNPASQR